MTEQVDIQAQERDRVMSFHGENRVYFYCPDCSTLTVVDSSMCEQETCSDCGDNMLQINRKYYNTLRERMQ